VEFTDLQGALVNLALVSADGIPKLAQRPEIAVDLWDSPASAETLRRRILNDRSMVVWEMRPAVGGKSVGYIGIVRTGSPFLFVDSFDKPDYGLTHDAMLSVMLAFFRAGRDEWLFFHMRAAARDEEAHGLLVEAGFDPVELPDYDPKKYASYVLRRETFEIYYEDGDTTEAEDDDANEGESDGDGEL
jgi:hypothetical protein